jgi:Protein of unknown function (DUF4089)
MTKKPTKAPAKKRKSTTPSKPRATARSSAQPRSRPSAATPHDPLDAYLDAAANILGIAVESAWKPAIKANLQAILQIAVLVDHFALPDEAEPAPVYGA